MIKHALFLTLLFLAGGAAAQDLQPYPVADFENGLSGFEGKITHQKGIAKEGQGAGKMEADFTNVTQSAWITAKKPLDLKNEVKTIRFWIKTSDAKQITVRVVDSSKQSFQTRPAVNSNGEWQEIKIDSLTSGPGFQSFGEAKNKTVHWPLSNIQFILEKSGLVNDATKGSVLIDKIELGVVGAPKSATPSFEELTAGLTVAKIGDFEGGLDGFGGPIKQDTTVAKEGAGSGKVEADLANVTQSAWVTISKPLDLKNEIKAIRFWVKSAEAKQITVRLVDSTKQTLQLRPPLKPGPDWQQVTITSFDSGPGFQAYGGAADKKPHWPAKSLSFIIEKSGLEGGKGTVWLDGIELFLSNERLAGKLEIGQERPGNVFHAGEKIRIPVETQGDKVAWSILDFNGQKVAEGNVAVKDKEAVIEPEIKRPGYYDIRLAAEKEGAPLAEGVTSCIVVTPLDLANLQSSAFGVCTHFSAGWTPDFIPVLEHAGIKHVRDELFWANVEEKKGQFAFPEKFDKYMADLKRASIDPLIVLSFGNPNYDSTPKGPTYGNAPHTDEGREGYTRYALEVLKRYGKQIQAVEIWNEYNGTFCRGPASEDRPKYYFEMIKNTAEAIKKDRPDITIVGISAVATPFPYFEDLFKRGALQYMDAVSLHPYRTQGTPEGLDRQMKKLQDLIKKYNNGVPKPIWITELTWYVKGADERSDVIVTEADQAKYLVRSAALTLGSGVERFNWYLARDDKSFPTSGLFRSNEDPKGRYAPKPSAAAFANIVRQLDGARFERREMTLNEDVYAMLFRKGNEEVRILWSLEPATLLATASAPLTVVDVVGGSNTIEPAAGKVKIELSDTPIYVRGGLSGLPPVTESSGKLQADAEEEFSSEQGADGWSYGFFVAPSPGAAYAPGEWKPMPRYNVTIWGYEWIGDQKYLKLTPSGAHPALEGDKPVWAVRRWTSDVAGKIQIKGRFGRPSQGDGTTGRIFVDGKEVWKQQVGGGQPSSASYDVTVPVQVGSMVDFAVDPGPAKDTSYDATSMAARITLLP